MQKTRPTFTDPEAFIEELLSAMTLEEKVSLCHAGSKFSVSGIPRLGIPEFVMSDGPHGVRHEICRDSWDAVQTEEDRSTYLPTGTALAATWNPEAAYRFGLVLGAEARHRGKVVILGPGINIIRTPLCGRNFEYFSEDPHLISALVVPQIRGIQSRGVAACVKHFAANNQELNRHGVDARMNERTLREIYLPGFEAAVREGLCATVMGAYNQFRGQFCCHNEHLVNTILKGEWGFDGSYISDWAGVKDTMEAALFGCDIEMGTPVDYHKYFLADAFRAALEAGKIDEEVVNDKVRRNLRTMVRAGVFDPERPAGERNSENHHRIALEIAREAIVLLKNEGPVLPLEVSLLKSIVVVGDNATAVHASGGHSSGVKALYEVTPLAGLRNRLGTDVEIRHFQGYPRGGGGIPIEPAFLDLVDEGAGTHGWRVAYWPERHFQGEPVRRIETAVDFEKSAEDGENEMARVSARWESILTVPENGTYEFVLTGANQARLEIDGQMVIHQFETGPAEGRKSLTLEAGRAVQIVVELLPSRPDVRLRLDWIPPWAEKDDGERDELFAAVQVADAVLFFGGLNHQYDLESADRRDMRLHEGQDELIAALAAKNPRMVAVVMAGSPVEMPWVDLVPAILFMGYAGMEGGHAIADVLLGHVNPSGKLPMTLPKRLADSPAHALEDYQSDVCHYREGVFVGYRWFDARGVLPLFPFGHGLSYSRFSLADLQINSSDGRIVVSLKVTNDGLRFGGEVVQIYVGRAESSVDHPVRELKGFRKVFLEAGECSWISISLEIRDFSFWSEERGRWLVETREFTIEAGTSSRNLPLRTVIALPEQEVLQGSRERSAR